MKNFKIILFLIVLLICFNQSFPQKAAIKIEAMSIHKLHELGLPNPNNWDYVSTGLSTVGVGTMVWLTGWDTTGNTAFKPANSYLWEFESKPSGSLTDFTSANTQLTSFQPDLVGDYIVRLTITTDLGTNSTTQKITASNYTGTNWKNVAGAGFNCASCHATATPTVYTTWKTSDHATMFERGMNGQLSPYWGESCFKCHTTGYNLNSMAVNGGFDDVAQNVGFIWDEWKPGRAGLFDSLLTTDKKTLSLVAGITCESCHGPKDPLHFGAGTQPKTMDAGVCAQCHDEPWRYNRYVQWENSGHSEAIWSNSFRTTGAPVGTNYNLNACVRCHDGQAFVNFTKGKPFDNSVAAGYGPLAHTKITCQTCHEPHSMGLRTAPASSDTLGNGYDYSSFNFGDGKICVNCHKYRRNNQSYVLTPMSPFWGPHYRGATDIFLGQNGYTFGANLPSSIAHQNVENTCVGCHMSATPDTGTPARDKIGMHTWNMRYVSDTQVEYHNVTGCISCHSGINKFEDIFASYDYDKDGNTEPFIVEVNGLLKKLAKLLPPFGSETINRNLISASPDSALFKKAFWNYLYVNYDGSNGVHNPKYVVSLLQNTIENVYYAVFAGQIGAIQDVPNDQGKQVQIIWYKFPGETDTLNPIKTYAIWRMDDSPIGKAKEINDFKDIDYKYLNSGQQYNVAGIVWTFVGWTPVAGFDLYSVNVPTLYDSTVENGIYWTKFKISGHAADYTPLVWSKVDSGYSVDNLVPNPPLGLTAKMVVDAVKLEWQETSDPDIKYFAIYKGLTPDFDYENTPPIGTTTQTYFVDSDVQQGVKYYYVVRGVDFSGNKGKVSLVSITVLDVNNNIELPTSFALGQNYPNPFNPSTSIKYQVPVAGNVKITVYNAIGQEIVTLVNRNHEAGYYTISWNGIDKSGNLVHSGIYLYKMVAGNYTAVKKMLFLK